MTPPTAGSTLETGPALELDPDHEDQHAHTVHLAEDDLRRLQRGETVTVTSSATAVSTAHTHDFALVDQLGPWGAPTLETGGAWPQPKEQGGLVGRPNIEIYNMPNAMATEQPPLVPREGISVPVYVYVSGVPEGPEMLRNRRLTYSQPVGQLTNVAGALLKQCEDLPAAPVGQGRQRLGISHS